MKLKDCKFGILVTDGQHVGMIVGITNNRSSASLPDRAGKDYAVPLVAWSSGEENPVHPANIEVFKD